MPPTKNDVLSSDAIIWTQHVVVDAGLLPCVVISANWSVSAWSAVCRQSSPDVQFLWPAAEGRGEEARELAWPRQGPAAVCLRPPHATAGGRGLDPCPGQSTSHTVTCHAIQWHIVKHCGIQWLMVMFDDTVAHGDTLTYSNIVRYSDTWWPKN